jgi:predicted deacylase
MSFSAGASLGIPSVLAEASGQGLWPEVEIERLTVGVERVMRHLAMLAGENDTISTTLLQHFAWLSSDHSGLWYPSATAGDEVKQGQPLGTVKSLLAETLQEVSSPLDGTVLFSVTSLAINGADPLFGIGA